MSATVYNEGDDGCMASWVMLYTDIEGDEPDIAGPFHDQHEAVMMAKRSVYGGGVVNVGWPHWQKRATNNHETRNH